MQDIFLLLLEWLKQDLTSFFLSLYILHAFCPLGKWTNSTIGLYPQSSEFYKVTTEQYQKAAEEVEAKFK